MNLDQINEANEELSKTPAEYLIPCKPPVYSDDDLKSSILISRKESTNRHYECYTRLMDNIEYLKRRDGIE